MTTNSNEKQLKRCLKDITEEISNAINKLQPSAISESDINDISTSTFTLNIEDDEEMDKLKANIEKILIDRLPGISGDYKNYLLNFLSEYNYDSQQRQFKDNLNMSHLLPLYRGMNGLLASIDALQAAWDGKLSIVEKFIKNYPSLKDKPGLWGTTLLYSAARNNHMNVIKYLIETARCSVNAQNEQHLEKVLSTKVNYEIMSKAASTALHAACYQGHFEIVKYLIEHGANYFIKNQALETPLMNIRSNDEIIQYFRNYLLLGYLKTSKDFPDRPLSDETRPIVDCIWEYKPFNDTDWQTFSSDESKTLQQSLIVSSNQEFKLEIHLTISNEIYKVSTIQFLRSDQLSDENNNNLSWIRCRGSSILNFDCYSLWQIMFLKHPQAQSNSLPSTKIYNIPANNDSTFEIHLNSWYNCDANTNSQFDHSMDYRQRLVHLNFDLFDDDIFIFNLQTFTFRNQTKTIKGFIRWIPKLILNNEQNKNKITYIDNFSSMVNLNPLPLTTKRLEQFTQENDHSSSQGDDVFDDSTSLATNLDEDDDDDHLLKSNETNKLSDSGIWTINDIVNDDDETPTISAKSHNDEEKQDSRVSSATSDETDNIVIDDSEPTIATKPVENTNTPEDILEDLRRQINEIEVCRNEEKRKVQQKSNLADELQGHLAETIERVEQLSEELKKVKQREEKLKQIVDTIKTIQYTNIQKSIIHEYLLPKYALILDYLKRNTKKLDDYFTDRIPTLSFKDQGEKYTLTLTGVQSHHQAFKDVLQRVITLSNTKQGTIEFYQRHLNRITRSINQLLFKVQPNTKYWKQFSKLFYELLKAEGGQYWNTFKDFIQQKTIEINESVILGDLISPRNELRKESDSFMQQYPFKNEIERLKHETLDKFIQLNISFQQLKLGKKPTQNSINTIQHFITKIKKIFKTDPKYIGYDLRHFCLIPLLLQRLLIYYYCFTIQLPLYDSSKELLKEIKKSTVTTISTSTGSGKSTLLPALLIAEGYDKVIVTQPRRLPCKLLCERVNDTIITDTNPRVKKLAGWAVSGDEQNSTANILYLTDGLLKERLLNDKNFISDNLHVNKSIVIFVDEVHERSVNIDLCLALIARQLNDNPVLTSKVKIIISSATLDTSLPGIFRQIPHVILTEFKIPLTDTLYPVKVIHRPNENILDIVQEIYYKRERQDQILCFVSSASEVNHCCKLLTELSHNTIKAYPLIQSQSARVQTRFYKERMCFFLDNGC